jgi:hypothetical protein
VSSTELTIVVGILAGAAAIGLYLRDRYRSVNWDIRRDLVTVLLMATGLAGFGFVLLADESVARTIVLVLIFVGVGVYFLLTSHTRHERIASYLLLAVAAASLLAWLLRALT